MQDIVPHAETPTLQTSKQTGSRDSGVQSITRALRILEALASNQPIGLSELSRVVKLHKSTLHRILGTLEREGYVRQDPGSERFNLGLRILTLAEGLLAHLDIREHGLADMQELMLETQETVHLGVMVNHEVMCVESVVGGRRNAIGSMAGKRTHAHVSSMGKAMLAFSPDAAVQELVEIRGLPRLTPNTITNSAAFRRNLIGVREMGYGVSDEEEEIGIRCIASPIFDHRGEPIAALSVAAPAARLEGEFLPGVVDKLVTHADHITGKLGGPTIRQQNGTASQ